MYVVIQIIIYTTMQTINFFYLTFNSNSGQKHSHFSKNPVDIDRTEIISLWGDISKNKNDGKLETTVVVLNSKNIKIVEGNKNLMIMMVSLN